ncbi:MAG: TonB-dependent receptor [Steroidobacteraceae bacterium]
MRGILVGVAGLTFGAGALAQGTDGASAGLELEEITVTAEKREVNLQKAAVSVTAVSGESLQRKGISTLDKAIQETASVKIATSPQGGTGASIFIRGVGSNFMDPDRAAQPAVAINVDGVTNSTPSVVLSSMFDVDRVEVLRGPQGTLYGSSAEGGVVNIVLANPKPIFEVKGRAQVGNYNAREVEGMLNVPLIQDKLALRFTASNSKRDAYIRGPGYWTTPYTCAYAENPAMGAGANDPNACVGDATSGFGEKIVYAADNYGATNTTSYRVKAKFDPFDGLSIMGTYERTKLDATDVRRVRASDWLAGREFYSNLTVASDGNDTSANHIVETNTNLKNSYKLDITADLGNFATLTLRPARTKEDPTASAATVPSITSTQDTYEAVLSSKPASRLIWTGGAYYRELSQDVSPNGSTVTAAINDGRLSTYGKGRPFEEWNVFGQATYPIVDTFRLTAGARYSNTKSTFIYQLYNTPGIAQNTIVPLASISDRGTYSVENTDRTTTWKVGAEYDVAPKSLAYFTISTGYKAGGFGFQDAGVPVFTPNQIVLATYEPEDSTTFELGSKNRFFDDRLQLNGALFYNIWKNMQIKNSSACSVAFPNCTGLVAAETTQSTLNADKSKQYGAELEATWVATANDRINLSLSTLKGTYGNVLITGFGGAKYQLQGHRMSNTPSLSGSFGYEHVFVIDDKTKLTAKVDEQFSTRYFNTQEYWLTGVEVPGYGKTDVALTLAQDNWSLNLYGRNLTEKVQNLFAHPQGYSPSEPRIYGVGISVSL